MKIVINTCYGGFSVADTMGRGADRDISRTDPELIRKVETCTKVTSGPYASLAVVEIPDNSFYIIEEYDGMETVHYSASPIYSI